MELDTATIRATVQTYLDGLYEGDADKLGAAFHPTSALTWTDGDALKILSRGDWLDLVRNRPSPKARNLRREDEILQIDQASASMAFVKLRCAVPPRYFTDYLCLLHVEGRWQIVQKVYSAELRES
jgi:hypothetical protein